MWPLTAKCGVLCTSSAFIGLAERKKTDLVNQDGICKWMKQISERVETETSKSLCRKPILVVWMRVTCLPVGGSRFMRCRAEWAPDIFAGESRTDWETQERVPIGGF